MSFLSVIKLFQLGDHNDGSLNCLMKKNLAGISFGRC